MVGIGWIYLHSWVEAWMLRDFEATGAVQYHSTVLYIYQVRDTSDCRRSIPLAIVRALQRRKSNTT